MKLWVKTAMALAAWLVILLSVLCGPAHAAGMVQQQAPRRLGNLDSWVLEFDWTGDAATGSVPNTLVSLSGCEGLCQGYLVTQIETIPKSPVPSANYSVTFTDQNGVDFFGGAVINLSNSVAQTFPGVSSAGPIVGSPRLSISAQTTASAQGSVLVFLRKPSAISPVPVGAIPTPNWLTIANPPFADNRVYNFQPQTQGIILTAGIPNTVPLHPCPPGITSAYATAGESVYISGPGTPESVVVTSVTGSGGGCTIGFTPANNHTGETIQSATAGGAEALWAIGGIGTVVYYAGNWNFYAPLVITTSDVAIVGDKSRGAVFITDNQTSGNTFSFSGSGTNSQNVIANLKITAVGGKATGWTININNQNTFTARDIFIGTVPNGIQISNAQTFDVYIEDVNISSFNPTTGVGILLNAGSGIYLDHVQMDGQAVGTQPLAGVEVITTSGFYMSNSDILQSGTGLLVMPGNGQIANYGFITNVTFDTNSSWGIFLGPGGTSTGVVRGWHFTACWTASNTLSGVAVDSGSGGGSNDGDVFVSHRFVNNTQRGLITFNTATNVLVDGSVVAGNGNSTVAGIEHGSTGSLTVSNSILGQAEGFPNTQTFGITLDAVASDNIVITGNKFGANVTGQLSDSSTGIHKLIADNLGIETAVPPTIASGATISLAAGDPADQPTVYISGTTQITTINGGWIGRTISLIFTNAAPGGVGTGGNVARTQTAAQNQKLTLTFDGTNWY